MTFSNINVSQPNDGLGDKLRDAFVIVNNNFASIGTIVDPEYISATLSSYTKKTYVDNADTNLQNQIDSLDGRLGNDELDIAALQTDFTNLTLSVNGKASSSQLNSFYSQLNAVDADLQIQIDGKIDDAPIDGKTYGRKDQNWTEIPTGGVSYQSFVALLTQESTADPTAIELQNDFTATITYRYQDVGIYKITASSEIFTKDKTICFYTAFSTKDTPAFVIPVHFEWWNTTEIYIYTDGQDNKLRGASIEIRVYK